MGNNRSQLSRTLERIRLMLQIVLPEVCNDTGEFATVIYPGCQQPMALVYVLSKGIESKDIEKKIYREQKREVSQRKSVSKSSLLQDIKNADFRLRVLVCGGCLCWRNN